MDKKQRDWEQILEIVVIVMLGITALLTAWATWIGSLHGGNQATSYTTSNNLASEGNSEYNAGVQQMNQDMLLWNDISDMQQEISFAQEEGDDHEVEKVCYQLMYKLDENLSERMAEAIGWSYNLSDGEYDDPTRTVLAWMESEEAYQSPFFDNEFVDGYFVTSNELLARSQEELEKGKESNDHEDAYGLVTVIYSVVLFLLGIAGSFKRKGSKFVVGGISLLAFVIATIYMLTIPMPAGFSIGSFFGG